MVIVGVCLDDCYLIVNLFFYMFGYKVGWFVVLLSGVIVLLYLVF